MSLRDDLKRLIPAPDDPADNPLQSGTTLLDQRQASRLPDGYEPGAVKGWDPRLAYELALEMDSAENVFARYAVSRDAAVALLTNAAFVSTVKKYREEVVAGGVSFRLKAKIQAEDLLTHSYEMATDPEVPPAVRADLIKWTARVAALEPKDKGEGGGGTGGGFTLNLTFGGPAPQVSVNRVIDVTPEAG